MQRSIDIPTAKFLLAQCQGWFGYPAIQYLDKYIDGRVRMQAAEESAFLFRSIRVTTAGDAAAMLCIAGHYDRARKYVPDALQDARDIAAFCHCPVEIVAPLARKHEWVTQRMKPHTTPARRRAIERMAQLLRKAEQTTGVVSADEIRDALRQWL